MKRLVAGMALLLSFAVNAQEFPQRGPIEITCLFPAGSSADVSPNRSRWATTSATDRPRAAASRATPQPVTPPPMTRTSK